ncbi:hypothetical protein MKX03_023198 [Papaver bracteatum]|nr:hypothetical protein MKX03_023198 [Papaver bracteatum]
MSQTFKGFLQQLGKCKFVHHEGRDKLTYTSPHFHRERPDFEAILSGKTGGGGDDDSSGVPSAAAHDVTNDDPAVVPSAFHDVPDENRPVVPPLAAAHDVPNDKSPVVPTPATTLKRLTEKVGVMHSRSRTMSTSKTMSISLKANLSEQVEDLVVVRQQIDELGRHLTRSNILVAQAIELMLVKGIGRWSPDLKKVHSKAVVEFSCPVVGLPMTIKHLRSTIFGDAVARMLTCSNVEVSATNQLVDWELHFGGMLMEQMLETIPNWEDATEESIPDLNAFFNESLSKLRENTDFFDKAKEALCLLNEGNVHYRRVWSKICDISRQIFCKIYDMLLVSMQEKSLSFYEQHVPDVINELTTKGVLQQRHGACVLFDEAGGGREVTFRKIDGGYSSDAIYLTALWHRIIIEQAEWIIYVDDVNQKQHLDMLFTAGKQATWLAAGEICKPTATHMGIRAVLGEYSSFNDAVALLDDAKNRCKEELGKQAEDEGWSGEKLEQLAAAFGHGAVKYADLKNDRGTDYTLNLDLMLSLEGNTAIQIQNAHTWISDLISDFIRSSGKSMKKIKDDGTVLLCEAEEWILGHHLVSFTKVVEDACLLLKPNLLCEYLYMLWQALSNFF